MAKAKEEEVLDHELFDIKEVKITYKRSRDQKHVSVFIDDKKPVSEMKLYLILDIECRKLERRLGISDNEHELQ